MHVFLRSVFLSTVAFVSSVASAADLNVTVDGLAAGKPIPEIYARCKPDGNGKTTDGANQQPTIRWSGAPANTASFAVFVMDPDVPADFSDAGKEGKVIAKDAPRQDFYHYGVVNIPATATEYPAANADKSYGTELANDMGLNKYVSTLTAFGGPCPPWNDMRVHHYHFMVFALDDKAPVAAPTLQKDTPSAASPNNAKNTFNRLIASPHVLAKGTLVGTYTLNRDVSR